jgi:hypothetical protein
MFEQAVQASEALRKTEYKLIPALAGCISCKTAEMISSPVLARCEGCGGEMRMLRAEDLAAF